MFLWPVVISASKINWLMNWGDKTFGRNTGLGHNEILLDRGPQHTTEALTNRACSSLICQAIVMAKRKAILKDSHLMAVSTRGS